MHTWEAGSVYLAPLVEAHPERIAYLGTVYDADNKETV